VLILPPGHAQSIAQGRGVSTRERRLLIGVLGVLAAVVVIVVISIASSGKSSAHGCIYATIPGAVGAQEISECGPQARATCLSTATPGAFTAQAARVIAAQCRKAGVPVSR
jgi:hypothetical protein